MDVVNGTSYITEVGQQGTQYEQLLADIWVGVLLSLILLSCVCCMCTCLVYQKFQQWKRIVLQDSGSSEILPTEPNYDCESLPSYTAASGLPSYDEALQQLESLQGSKARSKESKDCPPPFTSSPSRVSLISCLAKVETVNEKT